MVRQKSVGFEHILPLMPTTERRPLLWFPKIRAALKLENLCLSLGKLFAILYPEDEDQRPKKGFEDH